MKSSFVRWFAGLVVAGVANTASAGFIHDLTVAGNFTGVGQITLGTAAGNGVAGVQAFTFSVNSSLGGLPIPGVFGLADIDSVSWNSADSQLSLILETSLINIDGVPVALVLKADDNVLVGNNCGAFGMSSGSTYCGTPPGSVILVGNANLSSTAVNNPTPAPAPATLALIGLGLVGLGWSRRKQQS